MFGCMKDQLGFAEVDVGNERREKGEDEGVR